MSDEEKGLGLKLRRWIVLCNEKSCQSSLLMTLNNKLSKRKKMTLRDSHRFQKKDHLIILKSWLDDSEE